MSSSGSTSFIETKDGDGRGKPGRVTKIAGALVVAEHMSGGAIYELVRIGKNQYLGEIIKLTGDTASIQCYEETAGLTIGDPVERTGAPLQVELGPGIMDNIFDGIQRPLDAIARQSGSVFVPRGVNVKSLDHTKLWEFIPTPEVKVGDLVAGGFILGTVQENRLINHKIMVPPNVAGKIKSIVQKGKYTLEDTIAVLEDPSNAANILNLRLSHYWPVRNPRPVAEKLAPKAPLLTGLRILDSMFAAVLGGTVAIPGAFGAGKGTLVQAVAKYSNTNAFVHIGCGERGNELTELLCDFPELTVKEEEKPKGQDIPLMQKSCIIANTTDMPVAAREASIYTGVAIGEYLRDQGLDVALMADSTSRWAEALKEISNLLGEMPGDQGYPSNLDSRIAAFYERAGRVVCLGSPKREGTLTIVGTVSPAGGDFTDPVVASTLAHVQTFWALDKKMAQRKHFPSVNWHVSFSKYERVLREYYEELDPYFLEDMKLIRQLLMDEKDVEQLISIVGKDGLSEEQKVTFHCARLIREDFLQQNVFSLYDHISPMHKVIGMAHCFARFYQGAKKAVSVKISWQKIETEMKSVLIELTEMKFLSLQLKQEEMREKFIALQDRMALTFDMLRM